MNQRLNNPDSVGKYWWAHENLPEQDADILLVFVELDGSVWYGKVRCELSEFDWWERFEGKYESQTEK
jgi:hypothetical protein